MVMLAIYSGSCMPITHSCQPVLKRGTAMQGPRARTTMTAVRRGAPKLRKQMPPTMAAADRQVMVMAIQSPLKALMVMP